MHAQEPPEGSRWAPSPMTGEHSGYSAARVAHELRLADAPGARADAILFHDHAGFWLPFADEDRGIIVPRALNAPGAAIVPASAVAERLPGMWPQPLPEAFR
ncbi:hypothetical protein [Microbacterium gorillae]|uniref:hypothetical protein n=1 Tax=Microbacterium gorillae TaxID=1231063 RepID=UPI001141CEAF|nr:hypothetical protein [Microbacterium gorillae]